MGRHPLAPEQVPDGPAGLRNGFFYCGSGEPPHALVGEGAGRGHRRPLLGLWAAPAGVHLPAPVFTLDRLHATRVGKGWVRAGLLTRSQRQSDTF